MMTVEVNLFAALVAGVLNMVIGAAWYSPMLFGKIWMKEMGMKADEKMGGKDMGRSYGITFVGALIMGYVTALLMRYTGASTAMEGITVGLWLWFGFAVTLPLNDVVFGKKSWNLYYVNAAYYLVVLVINGALLATWK